MLQEFLRVQWILIILTSIVVPVAFVWFLYIKPKFFKKRKIIPKKLLDCVVLSGPSGAGKGTLIERLQKDFPSAFDFCVSHTTRAPRAGEANGKHYHFTTTAQMQKMIDNGEFLEFSNVHGNLYGTSKAALEKVTASGKVAIIEIDVKGVQSLKKAVANTKLSLVYVFVKAPSIEELKRRIEGRDGANSDKTAIRLKTAEDELQFISDNPDFYDRVLVNDKVDDTYLKFKKVLKAFGAIDAV